MLFAGSSNPNHINGSRTTRDQSEKPANAFASLFGRPAAKYARTIVKIAPRYLPRSARTRSTGSKVKVRVSGRSDLASIRVVRVRRTRSPTMRILLPFAKAVVPRQSQLTV